MPNPLDDLNIDEYLKSLDEQTNFDITPESLSLYTFTPDSTIQDGDTVDNSRLAGFDTPESLNSDKATILEQDYNIPISKQKELGLQSKVYLKQLLLNQENQQFDFVDVDSYGRPIVSNQNVTQEMISNGFAVPTDRYNRKTQELYRRAMEKKQNLFGQDPETMQAIRDYNIDRQAPSFTSRLSESVDAFQAGLGGGLVRTGDWLLDLLTPSDKSIEKVAGKGIIGSAIKTVAHSLGSDGSGNNTALDEIKTDEYINNYFGYDNREATFQLDEAKHDIKQGNYLKAFGRMLTSPELIGESLGYMTEFFIGGGKFTKVGKALESLNAAHKAGKTAEAAKIATQLKNDFTLAQKSAYQLAKNAGFIGVVGANINETLETRKANNNIKDPTLGELAFVTLTETLSAALDKFAFEDITGLKRHTKDLLNIAKILPPQVKEHLIAKTFNNAGKLAQAGLEEAAQEYTQEWLTILGEQYDTPQYGKDILTEENIDRTNLSAMAGAGMGIDLKAASLAGSSAINAIASQYDKIDQENQEKVDISAPAPDQTSKPELDLDTLIKDVHAFVSQDIDVDQPVENRVSTVKEINTKITDIMGQVDTIEDSDTKQQIFTTISQALDKLDQLTQVDKQTIKEAEQGNQKSKDLILHSLSTSFNLDEDTANKFLQSSQFDKNEKEQIKSYLQRKKIYTQIKSLGEVANEIIYGTPQNIGLNAYLATIPQLMSNPKTQKRGVQLTQLLNTFVDHINEKNRRFQEAYSNYQKTQQPQIVKIKDHEYVIDGRSLKLINQVSLESKYAKQVLKEVEQKVNQQLSTQSTATKRSPASDSAARGDSVVADKHDTPKNAQNQTLSQKQSQTINKPDKIKKSNSVDASPINEPVSIYASIPEEKRTLITLRHNKTHIDKEPIDPINADISSIAVENKKAIRKITNNYLKNKTISDKHKATFKTINELTDSIPNLAQEVLQTNDPKTIERLIDQIDTLDSIYKNSSAIKHHLNPIKKYTDILKDIAKASLEEAFIGKEALDFHSLVQERKNSLSEAAYNEYQQALKEYEQAKKANKLPSKKVMKHLLRLINDTVQQNSLGETILNNGASFKANQAFLRQEKVDRSYIPKDAQKEFSIRSWFKIGKDNALFKQHSNILSPQALQQRVKELNLELNQEEKKAINTLYKLTKQFKQHLQKIPALLSSDIKDRISAEHSINVYHNPMSLLFIRGADNKYSLPDNVQNIIALEALNWLGQSATYTLYRTDDDIKTLLGMSPGDELTYEDRQKFAKAGLPRNYIAKLIGTGVYKQLGIKLKDNADGSIEEKLITDLGLHALKTLESMGLIVENKVAFHSNKTSAFVKAKAIKLPKALRKHIPGDSYLSDSLQPSVKVKNITQLFSKHRKLFNTLFQIESYKRYPSFEPVTEVEEYVDNSLSKIPQKQRETIKKLQSTPFKLKNEMYELIKEMGIDGYKAIEGYVEDIDHLHEIDLEPQITINESIERSYKETLDYIESEQLHDKSIYFKYNFWKNGRYGIDSNVINPQANKFHRHLFYIDLHKVIVDKSNIDTFKLAVVLSFGGKVDKQSKNKSLKEFDELLEDKTIQEAISAIYKKDYKNKAIIEAVKKGGEKFYTLDGLIALSQYVYKGNKGKKPFTTTLSMETDAITSGFILSLLQYPVLDKLMFWLNKGGIFTQDQLVESYGEWAENPTNYDSYQTLAQQVHEKVKASKVYALFTPFVDEDNRVTKFGRNLFKNPFMIFNYGASPKNIRKAFAQNLLNELYHSINDVKNEPEQLKVLQDKLHQIGVKEDIINNPQKRFSLQNEQYIKQLIDREIGKYIEEVMSEEFKPLVYIRDHLNQAFEAMFNVFDKRLKKEIKKREKQLQRSLTHKEIEEVAMALNKEIPGIRPYFGKSNDEKIVVMNAVKNPSTDPRSKVITRLNSMTFKQKTTSAIAYTYEFGNPGVAGGVITIHYLDGSIITNVMDQFDMLGIHDAGLYNLNDAPYATQAYNKATYEINSQYSIIDELVKQLNQIDTNDPELQKIKAKIEKINKKVQATRQKLYSQPLKIEHASFPGSMVTAQNGKVLKYKEQDLKKPHYDWLQKIKEKLSNNEKLHPKTLKKYEQVINELYGIPSKGNEFIYLKKRAVYKSGSSDIDPETFVSLFDVEVGHSNILNIYEEIGKYDKVSINEEHDLLLKNTLSNIVSTALKSMDKALLHFSTTEPETRGASIDNDLFINVSQQKPRAVVQQSAKEVYVHELLHHISKEMIETDATLQRQLNKLYNRAKKHITWQDFLHKDKYGNIIYLHNQKEEEKAAKEIYNYIFGGNPNFLHEFFVYGLTHQPLIDKLKTIPTIELKPVLKADTLLQGLINLFSNAIEYIANRWQKLHDKSEYDALVSLAQTISGINQKRVSMFRLNTQLIDKSFDRLNSYLNTLNKQLHQVMQTHGNKVYKIVRKIPTNKITAPLKILATIPMIEVNPKVRKALEKTLKALNISGTSVIREIITDIVGNQEKYPEFYSLLRQSKKRIDQERENTIAIAFKAVTQDFHKELADKEKIALNTIFLESDLTALFDEHYTIEDVIDILTDDKRLASEIEFIRSQLREYKYGNYYITQAEGLGHYMATHQTYLLSQRYNAHSIAFMTGTKYKPEKNVTEIERYVDILASLEALTYVPKHTRAISANVIKNEYMANPTQNGITSLVAYHNQFKTESTLMLFNGNRTQLIKGYVKETYDPDIAIKIAPVSEKESLLAEGYTLAYTIEKSPTSPVITPMAVYVSSDGLITPWLKSITSLTDTKARGTRASELINLFSLSEEERFKAVIKLRKMKDSIEPEVDKLIRGIKPSKKNIVFAPLYDQYGNIKDFRITMHKYTKNSLLKRETRFDQNLGRMFGTIVDKTASQSINEEVAELLYKDFEDSYDYEAHNFVKIEPKGKYEEIYAVLPDHFKYAIQKRFGRKTFFIREELISLVFGYRQATIGNLKFLKDRPKIRRIARKLEKMLMDIVKLLKITIVIKNPEVLWGNLVSNFVYLISNNLSPTEALKLQYEAYNAIKEYKEYDKEYRDLQLKRDAKLPYDRARMVELKTLMDKSPIKPLLDEGVFQSIVEDVDLETVNYQTSLAQKTNAVAQKTLPPTAIKTLKFVYMTKETTAFKTLLKFTQFSDFIARYALYKKLTEQGISHEQAIKDVMEAFIDYDVPQNRFVSYLQDIGVFMFLKFFMRIQRVIVKLFKKNPAQVILGMILQYFTIDVEDIMDSGLIDTKLEYKFKFHPVEWAEELLYPPLLMAMQPVWK